ncbi:MAG: tRNA (adenosine(37)-N6)-threonylcarbamoyltransferase complex transferase subunit TsaD [Phycisphaerales bacterium]
MLVLGVETSCDETACALVADGRRVLANVVASQDELHEEYAGVVPEIASRAHVERITPILRAALDEAGCALADIDAVAVGNRPGLIGSLLVGVAGAKALAWSLGVPVVGVDHVQSHLYAGCLERDLPAFPALGLVVSGGHTAMYEVASPTELVRIGATIDDAVGEAYDKCGVMLGLPFPSGPKVDALAQAGDERAFEFPVTRLDPDSLDFSYAGLKTSVLYTVRGKPRREGDSVVFERDGADLTERERADIAASFQRAAMAQIMLKLERALDRLPDVRALLVGGGVSANSRLRATLTDLAAQRGLDLRLPAMAYCLDNAAMIAGLGFHLLEAGRASDLSLRAVPTTAC